MRPIDQSKLIRSSAHAQLEKMSSRDRAEKPSTFREKSVSFNLEITRTFYFNKFICVNKGFCGMDLAHRAYFDEENKHNLVTGSRKKHNRWGDLDLKSNSIPRLPGRPTTVNNVLLSADIAPLRSRDSQQAPESSPQHNRNNEQSSSRKKVHIKTEKGNMHSLFCQPRDISS
jgi:hypothetical protein